MATFRKKTADAETTVEAGDLAAVAIVLGLAASTVAATFLVTRNPSTLRALAEVANSKGVQLLSNGHRVLPSA